MSQAKVFIERGQNTVKTKMGLWDQFLDWLQQLTEFLLGFFRPKPTLTLDEEIPVEASYGKTFCYSCDWPILN